MCVWRVYWENQAGGRQQQLKFAKYCSRNGPFAHWKGFKSSLTQQEEERSANVQGSKHVPFSLCLRPRHPPMPRSRCSPSYLKHLERTKPLRARTCFQPELRSLASTRFSVTCFEFVTQDNFDVSRSPFIFPIKCVELHDDCQLLISRFVTVQSA